MPSFFSESLTLVCKKMRQIWILPVGMAEGASPARRRSHWTGGGGGVGLGRKWDRGRGVAGGNLLSIRLTSASRVHSYTSKTGQEDQKIRCHANFNVFSVRVNLGEKLIPSPELRNGTVPFRWLHGTLVKKYTIRKRLTTVQSSCFNYSRETGHRNQRRVCGAAGSCRN